MADLDLARLKALAEQCEADSWAVTVAPDVILSLIARLEQVEQWAKSPPSFPAYWTPAENAATGRAKAEVLRLLREEAK